MLTKNQKQILDFIKKYIKKNDYAPSFEEIGKHFKLAKSTIHGYIEALKEKGHNVKLTASYSSQTVLIVWYPDGSMKPGGDFQKTRHVAAY